MSTLDSEIKYSDKYVEDTQLFDHIDNIDINTLCSDLIVLDNVLTPTECNNIIKYYETDGFVQYKESTRYKNVGNMIALTNIINTRCNGYIAKHYIDKYKWNYNGINNCWRCIKCNPTSKLTSHYDATSVKSINEMSKYTIMIYLSDNNDGAIYFNKYDLQVLPKKGRCVIFDLKLLHNSDVNSKLKYFIRSELYYTREKKIMSDDINFLAYELYQQSLIEKNNELEQEALNNSEILSEMIYNY